MCTCTTWHALAVNCSRDKLTEASSRQHYYSHLKCACNREKLAIGVQRDLMNLKLYIRCVQNLYSPVRFNSGPVIDAPQYSLCTTSAMDLEHPSSLPVG